MKTSKHHKTKEDNFNVIEKNRTSIDQKVFCYHNKVLKEVVVDPLLLLGPLNQDNIREKPEMGQECSNQIDQTAPKTKPTIYLMTNLDSMIIFQAFGPGFEWTCLVGARSGMVTIDKKVSKQLNT